MKFCLEVGEYGHSLWTTRYNESRIRGIATIMMITFSNGEIAMEEAGERNSDITLPSAPKPKG
jgi:hypothetical protein